MDYKLNEIQSIGLWSLCSHIYTFVAPSMGSTPKGRNKRETTILFEINFRDSKQTKLIYNTSNNLTMTLLDRRIWTRIALFIIPKECMFTPLAGVLLHSLTQIQTNYH